MINKQILKATEAEDIASATLRKASRALRKAQAACKAAKAQDAEIIWLKTEAYHTAYLTMIEASNTIAAAMDMYAATVVAWRNADMDVTEGIVTEG